MLQAGRTVDVGTVIDSQGIGRAQWILIGLCGFVALLDGLDLQAIGLAAPAIAQQLHIPPQSLGAVFSAALAGLTIGAFALGPMADRLGRKGVLVGATFFFGIFTLATAHADSFTTLVVYRFLAGVGLGGAMPSFISLASEYVPAKRRAAIVSLLWAAFPLGGTLGGLIASRLIPAYGWPSIFIVGGVLPLLIALALVVALPESLAFLINRDKPAARIARTFKLVFPKADAPDGATFVFAREPKAKADLRELFVSGRARGTLLLWVAYFFAFMILVTNSTWTPTLLRGLGVPVQSSALALAMFNFGSLFGSAAAGALVEALGPLFILSLTMIGGAVAFAAIGWSAPSVTMVTISESAFGFLVGTASSGLLALAAIYYPSAIRSTGVGWATAMGRFGSFVGPLVVGALVAAHWSVHTIFTAVAASIMIGAVACMLMPSGRAKS
ncbi:MAG TPA: MFS transporter [Pseudolabrys sp.]|jgi:AAHS family 4-hydroxybenzoate transporter-like MFS transporter